MTSWCNELWEDCPFENSGHKELCVSLRLLSLLLEFLPVLYSAKTSFYPLTPAAWVLGGRSGRKRDPRRLAFFSSSKAGLFSN